MQATSLPFIVAGTAIGQELGLLARALRRADRRRAAVRADLPGAVARAAAWRRNGPSTGPGRGGDRRPGDVMAATLTTPRVVAEIDAHEGPVHRDGALFFTTQAGVDQAPGPRVRRGLGRRRRRQRAQRHDARRRRAADRLRAGHADARRPRSPRSIPRRASARSLVDGWRRPTAQLAQRRRRRGRRDDLVHRPQLRPPAGLPPRSRGSATTSTATTPPPACTSVVADCFVKPNGIAFSPRRRTLYVDRQRRQPGARQLPCRPPAPHRRVRRDRRRAGCATGDCSR